MRLFNQSGISGDFLTSENYGLEQNILERELKLAIDEVEKLEKLEYQKQIRIELLKKKNLLSLNKLWYMAIPFIIFGLVIFLHFSAEKNIDRSLFDQYYNIENVMDQTRGSSVHVDAINSFQQKDYVKSSALFEQMINKDSSNMALWFYYGITNIETKNYTKSIYSFDKIIKNNDNLYIEHAEWYLALCYLKINKEKEALKELNVIATDLDNYYYHQSNEIIDKMKE